MQGCPAIEICCLEVVLAPVPDEPHGDGGLLVADGPHDGRHPGTALPLRQHRPVRQHVLLDRLQVAVLDVEEDGMRGRCARGDRHPSWGDLLLGDRYPAMQREGKAFGDQDGQGCRKFTASAMIKNTGATTLTGLYLQLQLPDYMIPMAARSSAYATKNSPAPLLDGRYVYFRDMQLPPGSFSSSSMPVEDGGLLLLGYGAVEACGGGGDAADACGSCVGVGVRDWEERNARACIRRLQVWAGAGRQAGPAS